MMDNGLERIKTRTAGAAHRRRLEHTRRTGRREWSVPGETNEDDSDSDTGRGQRWDEDD